MTTPTASLLWPFLFYAFAVVALVSGILVISWFIGERHEENATDEPYEGGIMATGSARLRFPLHFYIVAMLFVIFDMQAVFIIGWSISMRSTGWPGYIAVTTFIAIQLSMLTYVVRVGAFDFGPDGQKILKAYRKKFKKPTT